MSNINSVSGSTTAGVYEGYNQAPAKTETAEAAASTAAEQGVVYDKTPKDTEKATYSINKMSAEDRAALVQQLKADQASREASLVNIVKQMMSKQAGTAGIAGGNINDMLKIASEDSDSSMWKFIASGKYEVDEATRKQAQEDISEDGYWGVKQTSQRLFDFASALAGDDVEKMKEMQAAVKKGFDDATKSWGKTLPQISQDTMDATNKLFDAYYASKAQVQA